MLPKTKVYLKSYDEKTKQMYFLLKMTGYQKYITVFGIELAIALILRGPIYNKKFLKTKITSYSHEATGFHDNEISKVGSNYTCLGAILINFVFGKEENNYLQVFLKECKYIEKEKESDLISY